MQITKLSRIYPLAAHNPDTSFLSNTFSFIHLTIFHGQLEGKVRDVPCAIFVLHKFRRTIILKVIANVKKSLKHRHLNLFDLYIRSTP